MYYVYLIKSISDPDKSYVGFSMDLKERLRKHNKGGSKHTMNYIPWRLVVFMAFADKGKALNFEKYLKSHAGRAFAKKRLW